jgi:hypothetical protein
VDLSVTAGQHVFLTVNEIVGSTLAAFSICADLSIQVFGAPQVIGTAELAYQGAAGSQVEIAISTIYTVPATGEYLFKLAIRSASPSNLAVLNNNGNIHLSALVF